MIKQVIVIRKDLKMRRGKEIAQGSHASMAFMSRHIRDPIGHPLTDAEKSWIEGTFTKICLIVESEEDLLAVQAKAREVGIKCIVITDSGRTEFNGVPTNTCLALGPDEAEKIDAITGHLRLY
jgi:peptidyl-tRNA hydrolase, PTH2 family